MLVNTLAATLLLVIALGVLGSGAFIMSMFPNNPYRKRRAVVITIGVIIYFGIIGNMQDVIETYPLLQATNVVMGLLTLVAGLWTVGVLTKLVWGFSGKDKET